MGSAHREKRRREHHGSVRSQHNRPDRDLVLSTIQRDPWMTDGDVRVVCQMVTDYWWRQALVPGTSKMPKSGHVPNVYGGRRKEGNSD